MNQIEKSVEDVPEFDDALSDEALNRRQDLFAYALCGSWYCGPSN